METQETTKGMTIREAAISLGLRSQSVYNLLRDDLLRGQKTESGEWVVAAESVERYRLRRNLRRAASRSAQSRSMVGRSVIDVTAGVGA